MAKITLQILGATNAPGNGIDAVIAKVKNDLKQIEAQPIKIKIDASGLEALDKDQLKALKSITSLAKETVKLERESTKQAQASAKQAVEQAKVQQQQEKTAQSANRLAAEQEKTAQSANRLAAEQEKTAQSANRAAVEQAKGAAALKGYEEATDKVITKSELLNNIIKNASWYLISGGVAAATRAFKDAVATMKEVDTELTNIQKVSNLTSEEIKEIGDAAYSTASKYGVAADEYLSAVYTFQKAGLGDRATEMAELATKTMLVGDTSADVATKFLVAINAAWGLNGSISALSKVVDEADYINNNYATDLEKLSAGMPIVASTAANLNMTIEETLAVLGTITAATQESGTKAATAWRALVMNITGELGTITDETGETIEVTKESVSSITDALKIYGNESVQAAINAGKVINPMEAVISLAQAYKDNLLNDIELENILMSVGGKLRTNQLTALVKDLASETSVYYDIMSKLPEAAGTADNEVSIMLSSWESKTQILKNTWTEFLTNFVDTEGVKSGIDLITLSVEGLDTTAGKAVVTIGALVAIIRAFAEHGEKGIIAAIAAHPIITAIVVGVSALVMTIGAAKRASEEATEALRAAYPELYALKDAVEAYDEAVAKANDEYDSTVKGITATVDVVGQYVDMLDEAEVGSDKYLAIIELLNNAIPDLNLAIDESTGALNMQKEEILAAAEAWQEYAIKQAIQQKYTELYKERLNLEVNLKNAENWSKDTQQEIDRLQAEVDAKTRGGQKLYEYDPVEGYILTENGEEVQHLRAEINRLQMAQKDYNDTAEETRQKIEDTDNEIAALDEVTQEYITSQGKATDATDGLSDALDGEKENAGTARASLEKLTETLDGLSDKLSVAQTAFKDFDADGKLSWSTLSSIIDKFGELDNIDEYVDKLSDAKLTSGELRAIMGQMTYDLVKQKIATGELTQADIKLVEMMLREAGVANSAEVAMSLFAEAEWEAKYGADAATNAVSGFNNQGLDTNGKVAAVKTLFDAFGQLIAQINASGQAMRGFSLDASDIFSFNPDDPFLDEQTKRLIQRTQKLKNWTPTTTGVEWTVGDGSGGGKGGGGSSSRTTTQDKTDPELERHKSIIELLKSELSIMEKRGDSEEKLREKYRDIQKALHDEAEYMRSIGADQKDINSLSAEWWDYEKKILSLDEKILKAKKEQQEALEKQQKALQDEIEDVIEEELDKAKALRDAELAAIDAEIKKIKERNEAVEKQNELEKLKADLLQKQNDLLKAQSERTVRIYNKDTGQWEWVADQNAVNSAQDAVNDAREKLADYRREQAQDEEIAALEARKELVNRAYDDLEDQWKAITDSLKTPARKIADILRDIAEYGTPELQAQVEKINELLAQITGGKWLGDTGASTSYTGKTAKGTTNKSGGTDYTITSEKGLAFVKTAKTGDTLTGGDGSQWVKNADGTTTITKNGTTYTVPAPYDTGGVLHGIGGIKATEADEMVLPPDVTAKLLAPTAGGRFKAALSELRALYGNAAGIGGATVNNTSATYNNGATYHLGGVMLTEGQAKSLSVYDLAQRARMLGIMNARG